MNHKDYAALARRLTKTLNRPHYSHGDDRPGFSYIYVSSAFEGRVALSEHEVLHLMKTYLLNTYYIIHISMYKDVSITIHLPSEEAPRPSVWSGKTELEAFYGHSLIAPKPSRLVGSAPPNQTNNRRLHGPFTHCPR